MGIASCTEPRHYHRLPTLDSTPEQVSPGAYVYSSQLEARPRKFAAPVSPPMSNYDPATKEMEDGQAAPRQQLPSLSSLFGPPSQARSIHSPVSDRPAGPYASRSPLDPPHALTPGLERPYNSSAPSSYFPTSAPPYSQPRTAHDPRFEDRSAYPPVSRSLHGAPSPRVRETGSQRPLSSSGFSTGSRWSLYQDSSRNEYSFAGHEPNPYKMTHERSTSTYPSGQKRDDDNQDMLLSPYDSRRPPQGTSAISATASANQPLLSNPPSTPAGGNAIVTVPEGGVSAKDGLGPKIWTGTHFLPRFVRAAEVAGEGMCYFYDDGSHCKTVIDGEAVNAHWGVTKAGKPRKRLAIACVTCREKKIKCDPDYPRCLQCEKFGRVCKFKNAPRGGHNTSPSTPPAELDETRRFGPLMRPPPEAGRAGSHSSEPVSPRTILRPASPDLSGFPAQKRMRTGYDRFVPTGGLRSPMGLNIGEQIPPRSGPPSWHRPEPPRIHEEALYRAWQSDPYVTDPQSVTNTVTSFFVHADAAALRFLPESAFRAWVQSAHRKSPEDLMLVYSILAFGLAVSGGPKNIAHEYCQVARHAIEHTAAPCLQLVQARIVLSLFYLAASRPADADDMSSAAISAATYLQLNLELDQSQDRGLSQFPFGLARAGFAECRRRTFWSCFLLERLNGLFPLRLGIINPQDIFLHLPAEVGSFEDQVNVAAPAFEPDLSSIRPQQQTTGAVGVMGHLIHIVTLWGDVMAAIYRISHRHAYFDFDYSKFHNSISSRLADWKSSLPQHLAFSPTNLEMSGSENKGSIILMHLVYHFTLIKLNRHVAPRFLTPSARRESAAVAHNHARGLLEVACAAAKDSSLGRTTMPPPFASHAILEAVDVLSAEGALSDLPGLVDRLALTRSVLEILCSSWEDSRSHKAAMDHRLDKLAALRDHGGSGSGGSSDSLRSPMPPIAGVRVFLAEEDGPEPTVTCWQMSEPLEVRFPPEMDCVYQNTAPLAGMSA